MQKKSNSKHCVVLHSEEIHVSNSGGRDTAKIDLKKSGFV